MLKKLLFVIAALIFSHSATQAEIVYSPATKPAGLKSSIPIIDFNNDSIVDVVLSGSYATTHAIPPTTWHSNYFAGKSFYGSQFHDGMTETLHARFLTSGTENYFASSLSPGTLVGETSPEDSHWSVSGENVGVLNSNSYGGGPLVQTPAVVGIEYFGFQFLIGAETHFGWMLVDRRPHHEVYMEQFGAYVQQSGPAILSWAYESDPNTAIAVGGIVPIPVPEPASCGAAIFASILGTIAMHRKMNRNAAK